MKYLVIVFCGFYLKITDFNPLYISFILSFAIFIYLFLSRRIKITIPKVLYLGLLYILYILVISTIRGFTSSVFNVLISVTYFIFTYVILSNDTPDKIVFYIKCLLKVSIALLLIEAIARFLLASPEAHGIYMFKFNSIMYQDSNYVAIFIMSLYFLAFYLNEKKYVKLTKYLIVLLILLIATFSRATILTTVFFSILFTSKISRKHKLFIFLFGGIVGAIIVAKILGDESNEMRFYIINRAVDFYFNESSLLDKLFGIGFGRSQEYISFGPHLFIVMNLLESGIVGFIILIILWIKILLDSSFACKYIMFPFLISGFAMSPHLITYLYCGFAMIILLEKNNKINGN